MSQGVVAELSSIATRTNIGVRGSSVDGQRRGDQPTRVVSLASAGVAGRPRLSSGAGTSRPYWFRTKAARCPPNAYQFAVVSSSAIGSRSSPVGCDQSIETTWKNAGSMSVKLSPVPHTM